MTNTEKRFWGMIKTDKTEKGDVERYQLFYVLARTEALWEVSARIYDIDNHCLKKGWNDIFGGSFGKMLRRAAHLFNPLNEDISTAELFRGLDSYNCETMIKAMEIYTGLFDFSGEME